MSAILGIINKRRYSQIVAVFLLAFPVVIFIFANGKTLNASNPDVFLPELVIDAGHGGIDCGAIAADGSKESDINLAIALKLRALSEFYGLDNSMTRHDDSTLSDLPNYSEHRDLERRAELVNEKSNCVYLSIHQNCYPTGHPSGSLVIYSSNDVSESFGKITHDNLVSNLNPSNRRLAEPAFDRYYILSHVNCPAILVECGFMSNFSEMEKLKSSEYQSSIAAVLMASFLQYTQEERYI